MLCLGGGGGGGGGAPATHLATMWAKLSLKTTMVVNLSGLQMVAGPLYVGAAC